MVRIIAQDEFEIVEYNLIQLFANKDCLERVEKYGVKRLPSIALNGKLLSCCGYTDITKETLMNGGIG